VPEQTQPGDFDPIFSQDVVIVGGHAVNLWASYYAARGDEVLAGFAPFTSKDADIFVKDKELAMAIAATAGWEFRNNPEARSPVLGAIILRRGEVELQVDVLHAVTGLTEADLNTTATITFENGKSYSVPAPDVMLKAKLANLQTHDQAERQDERHVRILTHCCAHYLIDTVEAVHAGELTEREAVERFMATLRTIASAKALDESLGLKLAAAIPKRSDLPNGDALAKLRAFYDHQIEKRDPAQ
jgi:hypothetical protein